MTAEKSMSHTEPTGSTEYLKTINSFSVVSVNPVRAFSSVLCILPFS